MTVLRLGHHVIKNHIVVEGIDGCGKSIFIESLKNDINFKNELEKELYFDASPFDPEATKYIRSLLKKDDERNLDTIYKSEALLKAFMSDNALHSGYINDNFDQPESNKILISDRYIASTLAYQSLDRFHILIWKEFEESEISIPGLTLYFDIDPELSIKRIEKRGIEKEIFEEKAKLSIIKANYINSLKKLVLAYKEPQVAIIDASKKIETVNKNAKKAILDYVKFGSLKTCDEYKSILSNNIMNI